MLLLIQEIQNENSAYFRYIKSPDDDSEYYEFDSFQFDAYYILKPA
jgi:hypothetical protein